MDKEKLMKKVVELYQIVSVVGGYVTSKINDSNAVNEINELTEPMRENIHEYKHNPFNMTNWDQYSDKLKDIFEVIKKELA